jgi:hypothetical protein
VTAGPGPEPPRSSRLDRGLDRITWWVTCAVGALTLVLGVLGQPLLVLAGLLAVGLCVLRVLHERDRLSVDPPGPQVFGSAQAMGALFVCVAASILVDTSQAATSTTWLLILSAVVVGYGVVDGIRRWRRWREATADSSQGGPG